MKRVVILVLAGLMIGSMLPSAVLADEGGGGYRVLIFLPERFHDEELKQTLEAHAYTGAEIHVAGLGAVDAAGVSALQARIDRVFDALKFPDTNVIAIKGANVSVMDYDLFITQGAGWYDTFFKPLDYRAPDPTVGEPYYDWYKDAVTADSVIGAIGAGTYPLLFSGILPYDYEVPLYKCDDLIDVVESYGYSSSWSERIPRSDGTWPPLYEPKSTVQDVNGAVVGISSIPNSWYRTDDIFGPLLIEEHGPHYTDFFTQLTQARYEIGTYIPIRLIFVTCGDVGGSIVVQNTGDRPIDMTGWQIRCKNLNGEVTDTYTFEECGLPCEDEVSVYYGIQPWSSEENSFYWPDALPFPPSGGTAELIDPAGIVHSTMGCGS